MAHKAAGLAGNAYQAMRPARLTHRKTRRLPGEAHEPADLHGLALALILAASFMVVLDFSIVNVALPSIEAELGFSASSVQWIVTAYAISFGGLLILGGRAADLFGRRKVFIAGLLIFTAASASGGCWC